MSHKAPADGTANMRHNYKDPDGRETVAHWPDLSARHADQALESLVQSRRSNLDSRDRDSLIAEAKVLATLSLRDKLDELTATLRHCATELLDSNATLNENVKTAAQHLHADAKDLKAHLRLVREEAA